MRKLTLSVLIALLTAPAMAAVFDVPPDEQLIREADAVVLATALESRTELDDFGQPWTITTLRVDQSISGEVGEMISLRERGGVVGNRFRVYSGVPQFVPGQSSLLLLRRTPAGDFSTLGGALGKFDRIEIERKPYFVRSSDGAEICSVTSNGIEHSEVVRSALFPSAIDQIVREGRSSIDYIAPVDYRRALSSLGGGSHHPASSHRGVYLNELGGVPLRWQVFDGGGTVFFDANGTQPGLDGQAAAINGADAWSGSGSDVKLAVGTCSAACEQQPTDNGQNAVILGGDAQFVSGESFLASAAWYGLTAGYQVEGETFYPLDGADIIVSNTFSGSQALLDAILTHEFGHAIGFRHSNAGSPSSSDAIMNSSVSASGAVLRPWDLDAVLTVYGDGPPCRSVQITNQSGDRTVGFQQSASLSISISNDGTSPEFQWYTNSSNDFQTATPIAGATSPTYNTGPLNPGTYYYWGKVFNDCSFDVSEPIVITALACEPARIITQPTDRQITAGSSASLSVTGGGSVPLSYQWYRGESGDVASPVFGATSSSFNTGVLNSDAKFWVRVSNSCGSADSQTVRVDVSGGCNPPTITTQPMSQTVPAGQSTTLSVEATSEFGSLEYKWFKVDDSPLQVGDNSPSLDTGPIDRDTTFFVEVSDSCGTTVSDAATVQVAQCELPVIDSMSGAGQVRSGSRVKLGVEVSGDGPFSYSWYQGGSGDTSAPITGASGPTYTTPALTQEASYWVRVSSSCGSTDSGTFIVTPVCLPPLEPTVSVSPAESLSGRTYKVSWDVQPGVSNYQLQESASEDFANATTTDVAGQSIELVETVLAPTRLFYRVRGIADCDGSIGEYSKPGSIVIVPGPDANAQTIDVAVPFDETDRIVVEVFVPGNGTAAPFTVSTSLDWLTIDPSSGTFPADGMTFTLIADPTGMQVGSNTASFSVEFGDAAKTASSNHGSTVSVTVSLVTPVGSAEKTAPDDSTLFIPAVAHAAGFNSQWQSDVRVTNIGGTTSTLAMYYTPAGPGGITSAKSTAVDFQPSVPAAFNDIVRNWYGVGSLGESQVGSLEIRAVNGPTSAVASSRTYNVSENGTFGQFIPAIPFLRFIGNENLELDERLSIQQIAQSEDFRTNVAILEASGSPASVLVSVFDNLGGKLADIPVEMAPGELKTLNSLLANNGVEVEDGRIEMRVTGGSGRIHGYASVVDNLSNDPFLIPAANIDGSTNTEWLLAGVGDFQTGTANWRTDMRLYNADSSAVTATLTYHPQGGGSTASAQITIAPGETKVLDNLLRETFNLENSSGLLRVTTTNPAQLVATARIYDLQETGTYGQFVPAAVDEEGFDSQSRPVFLPQLEQSQDFRTNVGIAEVSGQPVSMKITATVPGAKVAPIMSLDLPPYGFVQLLSLLQTLGFSTAHNAQLTIEVTSGTGSIIAYGSVVDNVTQDPTYVPGL